MEDLKRKNAKLARLLREKQTEIDSVCAKQADWEAELRNFCRGDFGYEASEHAAFDIRNALLYCHKSYCELYDRFHRRNGGEEKLQASGQTQQTIQIDPALMAQDNSQISTISDEQINPDNFQQRNSRSLQDCKNGGEDTEDGREQEKSRPVKEQAKIEPTVYQVQNSGTQTDAVNSTKNQVIKTESDSKFTSQATQTDTMPTTKDEGIQAQSDAEFASEATQTDLEPEIEKVTETMDQGVQVEFDEESDAARNRVLQAKLATELEKNAHLSEELEFEKNFGSRSMVRPVLQQNLKSAWCQIGVEKDKTQAMKQQLNDKTKMNLALHKYRADSETLLADHRNLKKKFAEQAQLITEQKQQLRMKAEMLVERKSSDYWKKVAGGFELSLKRSVKDVEDLNLEIKKAQTEKYCAQKQLRMTHEDHAVTTKYLRRGLQQKDDAISLRDRVIELLKGDIKVVNEKLSALRKLYNLSDKGSASNGLKIKLRKQEKQLGSAQARVSKMEKLLICRSEEISFKDFDIQRLTTENEDLKGIVLGLQDDTKNLAQDREAGARKVPEYAAFADDEIAKPESKKKSSAVAEIEDDAQSEFAESVDESVPETDETANHTRSNDALEHKAQQAVIAESGNESVSQSLTVVNAAAENENQMSFESVVIPQQAHSIFQREATEEEELQEVMDLLEHTPLSAQAQDHQTNLLIEQTQNLPSLGGVNDQFSDILRGISTQAAHNRRRFRGGRRRHQSRRVGSKHVKVQDIVWPWILTLLFSLILGAGMMQSYHLFGEEATAFTTYVPTSKEVLEAGLAAIETTTILQTLFFSTTKLHTELRTVTEISPPNTVHITETETQTETATIMQVFPSVTPQSHQYATSVVPYKSSLIEQRGYYINPNPASVAMGSILFVFVAWACRLFR